MIDQHDVVEYFDRCAPQWDAELVRSDAKIARILDNAHVGAGARVLDVACGTGVLIPDYLARGVGSVTGIDIAPEMIRLAREKFPEECVRFICGDAETEDVGSGYDAVVVYNAFPHFPDGARLIRRLASLLKEGGYLTIAHGMSREAIDGHHRGSASHVSNGLMPVSELAQLFESELAVTTVISDETMYQVAGRKMAPGEHSHGDGTTHSHAHGRAALTADGFPAEALLAHAAEHNRAHERELCELAGHLEESDARDELLDAADLLKETTRRLERALAFLRRGL